MEQQASMCRNSGISITTQYLVSEKPLFDSTFRNRHSDEADFKKFRQKPLTEIRHFCLKDKELSISNYFSLKPGNKFWLAYEHSKSDYKNSAY